MIILMCLVNISKNIISAFKYAAYNVGKFS